MISPGSTSRGSRLPLPAHLVETGLVAIARAPTTTWVESAVDALIESGVTCLELTLTMPGALDLIARLTRRLGSAATIGAGTVLTIDDAKAALDAGARFLVSPSVVPDVVRYAATLEVPCLPGAFTPSEIVSAWDSGAAAVKLFPASLGGVTYLRDIRAPLPDIPLIPTGGVRLGDVAGYIGAGAVALGVGGPLFGTSLVDGDMAGLKRSAHQLLETVAAARAPLFG